MTFEEFLEENNLTPENTPCSEHALMKEAYIAGYKAGKKNAIVWHKTDFKEPAKLSLKDEQKCLILFRNGSIWSATFWRGDGRCSFECYNWKEIEAWAELPEVKL